MTDRWVIAYDIDTNDAGNASVTVMTVYNRIKACLRDHGFNEFTQLSVYAWKILMARLFVFTRHSKLWRN